MFLGFQSVYSVSCIFMMIFVSALLAHEDDDTGSDLWDLTSAIEATEEPAIVKAPPRPSSKEKVVIINKPRGRFVGKGGKAFKSHTLGDGPKDSFSVLQLSHEDVSKGFVFKMKESVHKMAICAALDKFECKSEDSSPSLTINVFKFGSEEDIISTREWNCNSWKKEQGKSSSEKSYSIGGYGMSVQLTGNWDISSKATISILSYYQTTNTCPLHLPFDCDACKNSMDDQSFHCAAKGHLPSLMCHNSQSKIHGRSAATSSGNTTASAAKKDSKEKDEGSTSTSVDIPLAITLSVFVLIKITYVAVVVVMWKSCPGFRRNQVAPACVILKSRLKTHFSDL